MDQQKFYGKIKELILIINYHMSRSTTEIIFEPINIEQGDINYFNNQTTEILRRFIKNFKKEL